jgi:hypothetical protein
MSMGLFSSNSPSKWNHDIKIDKKQHRRDIIGYRTSSRPNHEDKRWKEEQRVQARKDRKAAAKAENGGTLCASILLASALGAAGLASQIARAKGWA